MDSTARPRSRWRVLALALVLAACGAARGAATPESAVRELRDALRDGRYGAAYELLSEDARHGRSRDEFIRMLETHPDDVRDAIEVLNRADAQAERRATVRLSDGEEIALRRTADGWRIDSNPAALYDASTPRAALRAFVRAIERGRFDVLFELMPNAYREGSSPERLREAWEQDGADETTRLVAALRASLDAPIEQIGDHATMPYGERFEVRFLREDGVWKIEDPD